MSKVEKKVERGADFANCSLALLVCHTSLVARRLSMPLSGALKATLAVATGVEVYAGASLTLAPRAFVRRTYGKHAPCDALTLKFAR